MVRAYTTRTMRLFCGCVLLALSYVPVLAAQTYTPKQIVFKGSGDRAQLLKITGLEPGAPITKAQIEAALQKLADTGAFTDLSYTVDSNALTIKVGGATVSSGQAEPVRYVNLVWWQPNELTSLLEARVPLFHGELPLTGTLTDQVCAALVQLLADKGVPDAKVEALDSSIGGPHIGLNVTRPEVLLGRMDFLGAAPSTTHQLEVVAGKMGMQDFESDVTARAIQDNVGDTEKNAGYLDATVDPPGFSAPRKDLNGYAVDATATVHPGELYRIASIQYNAQPPVTAAEAAAATGLKAGQPAGEMDMRIAQGLFERAYQNRGYLDVQAKMQPMLDSTTHTVALQFHPAPGDVYHLASVDTSALPPDTASAFTRTFQGKPGMVAGEDMQRDIFGALRTMNAEHSVRVAMRPDRASHTVIVALTPAGARGQPQ